ncbi:MAG: hypothetical protein LLF94_10205 [Chlamydiales bacterium]|nr:hypothetical protein [Chlamydiales bacterium]
MSISWNSGKNQLTVEKNGSWHQLTAVSDQVDLRKQFRNLASSDLPFKSFLTFPTYPGFVIVRLWAPWELDKTAELVKDVVEGSFTSMANLTLTTAQTMKVPYDVSVPSIYLKPVLPKSHFEKVILIALKVEEIAFFHFLKKDMSRETSIAIKRELQEKKLLSEARRNAHPLLKGGDFGVTVDSDRLRNDNERVHCFIGYPLLSNAKRLYRIPTVLDEKSMLQIGFQDLSDTFCTPYDMELDLSEPFSFTFLNDEYTITIDDIACIITYSSKSRGVLVTHRCADETFFGKSRTSINALIALLIEFANQLEDAQKYAICTQEKLLLELFNDLFAFRVQLSIANELECKPYQARHSPRADIEAEINQDGVLMPDLEGCRLAFEHAYSELPIVVRQIDPEIGDKLKKIIKFFTDPINDGTNDFPDVFAYYGATSSQLLLHFDLELAELFTDETVKTIMQLYKAYKHCKYGLIEQDYKTYLLIKQIDNGEDITIFSLIKKGLEDLDLIQYRLPPNRPFNRSSHQAELDYQLQLKIFSAFGSPLLKSICGLSSVFPEMNPFSQENFRNDTIQKGIERLIYHVHCDVSAFSNLHGYSPDAFNGEFERGIQDYIESFEITHENVVQSHIIDFVQRIIKGHNLLEPRFKHDMLDLKHFIAGLHSTRRILFVDGKATFRELILRCLYEIQRQEKISINSQLLIDTVYMFLKTVKAPPQTPTGRKKESSATLVALQKINLTGYLADALEKVILFLSKTDPQHLPYVVKCLNLLNCRTNNALVQANLLVHPLSAIRQKLGKQDPDFHTEPYFMLLPPP